MVRARIEPAVELPVGKYSSLVDYADQINRLGACCATYYDPERQHLVIRPRSGTSGTTQWASAWQTRRWAKRRPP